MTEKKTPTLNKHEPFSKESGYLDIWAEKANLSWRWVGCIRYFQTISIPEEKEAMSTEFREKKV